MRTKTGLFAIASAALLLTPALVQAGGPGGGGGGSHAQRPAQVVRGQQDMQRDRARDMDRQTPDRDRDRVRDQDRIHTPDAVSAADKKIYGYQLMTAQERKEFQERLRKTDAGSRERTEFLAQHREEMQKRAKEQGVKLDES